MRFQVLGRLRVHDGQAWRSIAAAQQRAVLAILLAEPGRTVSTERLIDEIWGERPPRAAVGTIQGYIMRLRRLIGGARDETLVTRGSAYELMLAPGDLDAAVFGRTVESARRSLAEHDLPGAIAALDDGLALWHGPAMTDVPPTPTVVAEVLRLDGMRLTAVEMRLGARLDLGGHGDVVDELQSLVGAHPLRELLWEHLMLALYRCGRRAEALEAFQRARTVLVEELGLEPGPQMRDLQAAILDDDPALARPGRTAPADRAATAGPTATGTGRVVTPAQLPPDVPAFTGRGADLASLDSLLPAEGDTHPAVVLVSTIDGTAGVGKTALAVHWARRVAARFPDGQLYVDLRGYSSGRPLRAIEALARFLHALDLPPDVVPSDPDEAAGLYRSVLNGKRMLVLLDNASHPDQVRPLFPGSAGCLLVITSRDQLGGLVARDGVRRISLDVLTADEAQSLLTQLLGADRVGAEPDATAELAALCGYLPLALRIAAANLAIGAHATIADYTRSLAAGDRLTALQVEDDRHASVRVAFDYSYANLPDPGRRMFRLLGLVPGPDFDAAAAAALTETSASDAARQLDRLVRTHLVEQRQPGRYALHDLLRRYAAEQADREDAAAGRRAALRRLLGYYLRGAAAAADEMYPQILRLPLPPADEPVAPAPDLADHRAAVAWLDAERPNLVAAVTETGSESADLVWRLADVLRGYFYLRMHAVDWAAVAGAGLAAAVADGRPEGRAAAQFGLATLHWTQGRHKPAAEHYTLALASAREAGWVAGEAAALGNLGNLAWALGRLAEAADHYTEALTLARWADHLSGQATALDNLGLVYYGMGRLDRAVAQHLQALALHRQFGSRSAEARTMTHLGETYHALGRLDDALASLTGALAVLDEVGDRNVRGDTLRALAALRRDTGDLTEALTLADEAVALARETGDQRVEAGARTTVASIHHRLGHGEQAVDGHRRALDLTRHAGNHWIEIEALVGLAAAAADLGDLDAAAAHARQALVLSRSHGHRLLEGHARTVSATVALHRRDVVEALDQAAQAQDTYAETGHVCGLARAHLLLSRAHRLGGDTGAADRHRRSADSFFDQLGIGAAARV